MHPEYQALASPQGFEPPTSCTAGGHSSKELSRQLTLFAIQNPCNTGVLFIAVAANAVFGIIKLSLESKNKYKKWNSTLNYKDQNINTCRFYNCRPVVVFFLGGGGGRGCWQGGKCHWCGKFAHVK